MCLYRAKSIFTVLLIAFASNIFAQTTTVSNPTSLRFNDPYSRFGIGTLNDGTPTPLRAMGGTGASYNDPYNINPDNPASYSFLYYTPYQGGMEANLTTLSTNTTSYATGNATLSYFTIGIPVSRPTRKVPAGIVLGLRPFAREYYNMSDTQADLLGSQTIHNFSGNGSVNLAYVGAAARYKKFSIGFNLGYMFGQNQYASHLINLDSTHVYNSNFLEYVKVGGLYWKGGVMYCDTMAKGLILNVGATFTLKQNISATRNDYWVATRSAPDSFFVDTSYNSQELKGKITLPTSFDFGIQLAKANKWSVAFDYTSTQWSQYRGFGTIDSVINKSFRASLGGSIVPNYEATRGYLQRITYRFGVYYGSQYVYLNGTTLNNYGFTFGASLPYKRNNLGGRITTGALHIGFDFGTLGTKSNGLFQESYARFTLGLSLSDKWFIPRKYD